MVDTRDYHGLASSLPCSVRGSIAIKPRRNRNQHKMLPQLKQGTNAVVVINCCNVLERQWLHLRSTVHICWCAYELVQTFQNTIITRRQMQVQQVFSVELPATSACVWVMECYVLGNTFQTMSKGLDAVGAVYLWHWISHAARWRKQQSEHGQNGVLLRSKTRFTQGTTAV